MPWEKKSKDRGSVVSYLRRQVNSPTVDGLEVMLRTNGNDADIPLGSVFVEKRDGQEVLVLEAQRKVSKRWLPESQSSAPKRTSSRKR